MKNKKIVVSFVIALMIVLCCVALSACSKTQTYTISYELSGGANNDANPSSYTLKTETITLQPPTKIGYTFVKWTEGDTIATGSTGNKTFTAEWSKDTYTITYVLNGGTNHSDNPNVYDTESTTFTLQNPTKRGYTFVQWTEGNTITTGSTGNKTFTAEWIRDTYTITYVLNGGTNDADNPNVYNTESATITLQDPIKRNYTFVKWTEGDTIASGSTGNKTFTAEWSTDTYTITYTLNGGTNHPDNPNSYDVESETITLKNPTKVGYVFVQWSEGNIIPSGTNDDVSFTAEWIRDTYTITYVLDNGINNVNNPNNYDVECATITLQDPSRIGFTFIKWTEGNTITVGSTGNKTFTAEWSKNTYTITYLLDGGTNHKDNPNSYDVESETITLQNPTKTGYTFIRWIEGNTITTGITGNHTFTAEWSKDTYTITYLLGGGTNHKNNPNSYNVESAIITLQKPTKTAYTFIKWTEGNTIATGSTGNKTFTAEWSKDTYTITYALGDGTNHADNPNSYDVESATITLQNPTKTGYTFIRWTEGNTITTGSTGNKTFTAEWSLITYDITYTLNQGTQNTANLTEYTIESANITLFAPTYTGYAFGGWFDNDEFSGTAIATIATGSTENKHFYAKWNEIFTYSGTTITGLTEIGNTIGEMTTPAGITAIADNAFKDKTNLTSFVVPAEIISIGANAFSGCTNLSMVTINNGLQTIGNNAFIKCAFTTFTVPSTVISVGDSVLGGCANLAELTIPYTGASASETVTSKNFGRIFGTTSYSAPEFVLCKSLDSNGNTVNYYVPSALKTVTFNTNITTIESNVFRNCTTLETINMPNTVETMDNGAFYGCTSLKSFTLPTSLTTIGDTTFQNCTSLTTLTTPIGLTEIKPNAFRGCTNLSSVTLNEGLQTIGGYAFERCPFTTFTVPSTATSVGGGLLGGCANLTELTIPYTGGSANANLSGGAQNFGNIFGTTDYDSGSDNDYFTECASENAVGSAMRYQIPNALKTVNFNTNITTIKGNVFRNCTTLETINMPNTVETMDNGAFYGCTSLKSFALPTDLTTIGSNAFQNCTALTTLTTPDNLNSIGGSAFRGCTNLSSVTLNEGLQTIGGYAFEQCPFTTFTVPSTATSVGGGLLGGCANLTELTIPYTGGSANANLSGGAQNFGNIFGTTDYDSGTDNDYFTECASENAVGSAMRYQIPNALKTVNFNTDFTTIKSYVFRNCTTLETINLPNSVTTISDNAFNGCTALTNVTIPSGVATIANNAFSGCTNLSSVTLLCQSVVQNLSASGIFAMGRTICVPSAILVSYQTEYSSHTALFVAITE